MHKAVAKYARSGKAMIAYQVIGQGSLDLVLIPGFPSNLEILAEDLGYGHLVQRLARFSRLIVLDPRGAGLSDGLDPTGQPDPELRSDDIRAVMDAAGCGRAALLGASDGAGQAVLFAARHPQRVRSLILHGGFASFRDPVQGFKRLRGQSQAVSGWGTGASLVTFAPARIDDHGFADWWGRLERFAASPTAAEAQMRMIAALDVQSLLSRVETPTLILHRSEDAHVGIEASRGLTRAIRGARLVELSGNEHPVWTGDVDAVADLVEEFLTGQRSVSQRDRVLAVALVAQILGPSGSHAASAAGRHMQERLALLHEALPKITARHGGMAGWSGPHRIDACFDGAARAVACAIDLRESAKALGLAVAQGLHAGDIDRSSGSPEGMAIDIAGLIAASTRHPDILLSRLAFDLVSGSGLQFTDHGALAAQPDHAAIQIVALSGERHLEPHGRSKPRLADLGVLSAREREVLGLVAEGTSNPQIAVQLGISEHTVKRHVANILLKLDLPSRAAAAGVAARQYEP
jgi:pimeloyl-ACP methyl ester carboxylesterase/DNA-binding CsgD family transcriptional regulator